MIRQCDKKDALWLAALMLEGEVFDGCSEDGVSKPRMVTYVKNMLSRQDMVVLTPAPGKMIHSFVRKTGVMWDIHTAIRRDCGIPGKDRVQMSRDACEWMIKKCGAKKFITHVPEGNRAAGIYARACGLVRAGVLTKAMMKNGRLVDLVIYQSKDEDIISLGGF